MLRLFTALLVAALLTGCCGHLREFPADWTDVPPAERLTKVPDNVLAAAVRRFPGYGFNSAGATMVACRGVRSYRLYAMTSEDEFVIVTFDPNGNFVSEHALEPPDDGT
jgi:hypothetical protein